MLGAALPHGPLDKNDVSTILTERASCPFPVMDLFAASTFSEHFEEPGVSGKGKEDT